LTVLLGTDAGARTDLRAALGAGETVVGRFFFVQRAQAVRDQRRLSTFEFLHATFGEYLVARLVARLVRDLTRQCRVVSDAVFGPRTVHDGLLHALLSFAPLTARGPVISFLQALASRVTTDERGDMGRLAVALFRSRDVRGDDPRYVTYAPSPHKAAARYARYGLNLVLLAVVYAGRRTSPSCSRARPIRSPSGDGSCAGASNRISTRWLRCGRPVPLAGRMLSAAARMAAYSGVPPCGVSACTALR
jgi:hypothetical protein